MPFGMFLDAAMSIPKMMHAEEMQNDAQGFNRAEAQDQRAWAKDMSDTAHTREMADFARAGLNPILAAKYGGSPTQGGSSASSSASPANVTSTWAAGQLASAQRENLLEQNEQIRADTTLKKQDSALRSYEMDRTKAAERLTIQQEATEKHETERASHSARQAKEDADIATSNAKGRKLEGQIDESRYGEIMRYIDRAMDAIRGGSSAIERHRNPIQRHQRVPPARPGR